MTLQWVTIQDTIKHQLHRPVFQYSKTSIQKINCQSRFHYYILHLSHLAKPANSPNDEIRRSLVLILKLNFKAAMEVNTIEINQKIVRRRLLLKIGCTGMFLGLAIGLSIPFMLTAILHLLGFGTKGIIPGSIAAEWQASLHNLTKGTFFACKFKLILHLCLIFKRSFLQGVKRPE